MWANFNLLRQWLWWYDQRWFYTQKFIYNGTFSLHSLSWLADILVGPIRDLDFLSRRKPFPFDHFYRGMLYSFGNVTSKKNQNRISNKAYTFWERSNSKQITVVKGDSKTLLPLNLITPRKGIKEYKCLESNNRFQRFSKRERDRLKKITLALDKKHQYKFSSSWNLEQGNIPIHFPHEIPAWTFLPQIHLRNKHPKGSSNKGRPNCMTIRAKKNSWWQILNRGHLLVWTTE